MISERVEWAIFIAWWVLLIIVILKVKREPHLRCKFTERNKDQVPAYLDVHRFQKRNGLFR